MNEIDYIRKLSAKNEACKNLNVDITQSVMQEISTSTTSSNKIMLACLLSGCTIAAIVMILVGLNIVEQISTDYYWAIESSIFSLT